MPIIFNWYGPALPFGILRVVPSYLGLRVYFNQLALNNAELRNPKNYTITASSIFTTEEVHNSDVWNVTPEDVEYPSYVDLDCTDLTLDKEYLLTITPGRISNWDSSELLTNNNTAEYLGVSILPRVQSVRAISSTLMEVIFSKEMSPTSGILNTSSYSFDKGLKVREATIVAPGVVHLLTSRQTQSEIYTLTIYPAGGSPSA